MAQGAPHGFYVGHVDEAPPGVVRFARRAALTFLLAAVVLGVCLALLLERFDPGVFEYGTVRDYHGALLVDPHPRLLTPEGPAEGRLLVGVGKRGLDVSVASGSPGEASPARVPVSSGTVLSGAVIRNPEAAMIEVHSIRLPEGAGEPGPTLPVEAPAGRAPRTPSGSDPRAAAGLASGRPTGPDSTAVDVRPASVLGDDGGLDPDRGSVALDSHAVQGDQPGPASAAGTNSGPTQGRDASGNAPDESPARPPAETASSSPAGPSPDGSTTVIHIETQTLRGEIVDTKCYLGAMKPGRGKPHRDCASLCIRGGIPAALLVRTRDGKRHLVHLLNQQDQPLAQELLEWVGEPVEITGTLTRRGGRLFLQALLVSPTRAQARSFVLPSRRDPIPNASSP